MRQPWINKVFYSILFYSNTCTLPACGMHWPVQFLSFFI